MVGSGERSGDDVVNRTGDQQQWRMYFLEVDPGRRRLAGNTAGFRHDVSLISRSLFRQGQRIDEGVLKAFKGHFNRTALRNEWRDMRPVGFEERPLGGEHTPWVVQNLSRCPRRSGLFAAIIARPVRPWSDYPNQNRCKSKSR